MKTNIRNYQPDARYADSTHYLGTDNRGNIVGMFSGSKRDAITATGLYRAASGYREDYHVYRWSRATKKLTKVA